MLQEIIKDGYIVLKNKISEEFLFRVEQDFLKILTQQLDRLNLNYQPNQPLKYYYRALAENSLQTYFDCLRAVEALYSMYAILASPAVKEIAEEFLIDIPALPINPRIHVMDTVVNNLIGKAGGYHETPQHQDWPALKSSIDTLVIWMPLSSLATKSYGLELVPKSHLRGHLPTREHEFGHVIDPCSQYPDQNFISPTLDRGDILIFSGFLVHRTARTPGFDSSRVALGFRMSNSAQQEYIDRRYPRSYRTIVDISHGDVCCTAEMVEQNLHQKIQRSRN